jgi:hypothetical protein
MGGATKDISSSGCDIMQPANATDPKNRAKTRENLPQALAMSPEIHRISIFPP